MILFSSRSSSIPDKSELGNGYFFSWSSFNVGRFRPTSLEGAHFFSSDLDFPENRTGSSMEVAMDSFVGALEGFEFFLISPLSFLNSYEEDGLPRRFAIVISMSCAFVASSWNVLGLLIYKT